MDSVSWSNAEIENLTSTLDLSWERADDTFEKFIDTQKNENKEESKKSESTQPLQVVLVKPTENKIVTKNLPEVNLISNKPPKNLFKIRNKRR